jgi:NADPH:quinone reductase-like Zn-dependent oxidoreductase
VREGKSVISQPLPLTLGAELSGVIEAVAPDTAGLLRGDQIFGVTNARFTGAYAEYAIAEAAMIAGKPARLTDVEAASAPVVACTAQQMLFDHARVQEGQTVVVLGAAGNVGGYAVQLAQLAEARVVATARPQHFDLLRSWRAAEVVAAGEPPPPKLAGQADAVIDTAGGEALAQAFAWLRRGGAVISAVAEPDHDAARRQEARAQFILVSVTTAALRRLAELFDAAKLRTHVGPTLSMSEAQLAHRMLGDPKRQPGKIILAPCV